MRSHRTTIFIAALSAIVAVPPAPALASSLLSGYGGPGQGSQAILGSAIVNSPRGGGGSGSSGSSGSSGEASGSLAVEASPPARGESSGGAAGGGSSSGSGSGGDRSTGTPGASAGRGGAHATGQGAGGSKATASFYPAAERIPAGASGGTLGLSGLDLAFIAIGFAALAAIGVATGRLARTGTAPRNR